MTPLSNRPHQLIQGQGETANQGSRKRNFHEVSGGDRLLWQTRMPMALSPYDIFQLPPSSRTVFEQLLHTAETWVVT